MNKVPKSFVFASLLALTACPGPQFSSNTVDLEMTYRTQLHSYWCWAAVAGMISEFYGTYVRQCEIAGCCDNYTEACNHPSDLDSHLDALGIKYEYLNHTLSGSELRNYIDTGNPIALGLHNHFVIIGGYTPDGFIVLDPAEGQIQVLAYSEVMNLGLGWHETHLIKGRE